MQIIYDSRLFRGSARSILRQIWCSNPLGITSTFHRWVSEISQRLNHPLDPKDPNGMLEILAKVGIIRIKM